MPRRDVVSLPLASSAHPEQLARTPLPDSTDASVLYDPLAPESLSSEGRAVTLLPLVYPSHIAPPASCPTGTDGSLSSKRQRGLFTPRAQSATDGTFVQRGRDEVLWSGLTGECGASHADAWGTTTLAVIDDGRVVAVAHLDGVRRVVAVLPSSDESPARFVVVARAVAQGATRESASIWSFAGGALQLIEDVGVVLEDGCGPGRGVHSRRVAPLRRCGHAICHEMSEEACPR